MSPEPSYSEHIEKWIQKNREYILQTISELTRIKTENLPPSGNEKKGQEYLQRMVSTFLSESDIDIFEIDEVPGIREHPLFYSKIDGIERIYKNRPNLVAKLSGTGAKRSLVFSGHIDTVPVRERTWDIFKDPYSGQIKDGRMYGRGIADMKAGTLCGFIALKCIKDLKLQLKGDLYAESVVDEEYGGVNGTIACRLRYPNINFAILAEPSALNAVIETAGGSIWKAFIEDKGPGGYSQKENPIYKIGEIISILKQYNNEKYKKLVYPQDYKGDKDLELMIFLVNAGGKNYLENASYIPKSGCVYFYLPTLVVMKEQEVRREFLNFMKEKMAGIDEFKSKNYQLSFETVLRWLGAHKTDVQHPGMSAVRKSYNDLKLDYVEKAFSVPCDAFAFQRVSGTEVVIIGPKGENYHGKDEYIEIETVFDTIKIMVHSALNFCS